MTNEKREQVIQKLNGLLEKNYDAGKGFTSAFNETDNLELKSFFDKQIKQRIGFGKKIEKKIIELSGVPNKSGSLAGTLHRAWMDIKATATSAEDQDEAILECCINGENKMIDDYNDFLKSDGVDPIIQSIVKEQRNALLESTRELELFENIHA